MSNTIVSLLNELGYVVDCIHYTNNTFIPTKKYDIIFSLSCVNLLRLVAAAPRGVHSIKIWHPGTSSIPYNNAAEMARIADLEKRRAGSIYSPKRQEPGERIQEKVLKLADHIVIIGGSRVLQTFPKRYHSKISQVTVATPAFSYTKRREDFVPTSRHFLWHFGNGAVHKGLDLLLEVFAQHPEWTLHITGLVEQEPDFMQIYQKELRHTPNIVLHGYVDPMSTAFRDIAQQCFCFVAPSCSESISTACAAMMKFGLYPLVSRETGIELPSGAGTYLEHGTVEEIENQIRNLYAMDKDELSRAIEQTQAHAFHEYSKEQFSHNMKNFLERAVMYHNRR
jgi:glycosyltransferase involved in cell wall biosynthesis